MRISDWSSDVCSSDLNAIFIDGLFIPEEDRIGEEGKGFGYILHSLNTERILIAYEEIAIGQDALRRAIAYAKESVVYGRLIGQKQGIQHPLAARWMRSERRRVGEEWVSTGRSRW